MYNELMKLLAIRYLGHTSPEDLIEWAIASLAAGIDSPKLRILAGLGLVQPIDTPEVEKYFFQSLGELGLGLPPKEVYLIYYVQEIATAILTGKLDPGEGCHQIYAVELALRFEKGFYPEAIRRWLYLDDGLDPDTCKQLANDEWEKAIKKEAQKLVEHKPSY